MNKYHARKTQSAICGGRIFDSMAEARRGEALRLMELAGEISNLEYQLPFVLSTSPRIKITIDFKYVEREQTIYEDFKGCMSRDFRVKLAWLSERYGIQVRITK